MMHKTELMGGYFVICKLEDMIEDNFSNTLEETHKREIGLKF